MAERKLTTFKKLDLKGQQRVAGKVHNYPTLLENVQMLERIDPVVVLYANRNIVFASHKELFTNAPI